MDTQRIRELAAEMTSSEGISWILMGEVYKQMACRSLEAAMGTLENLCIQVEAEGARALETARQVGDIAVFAPDTGNPHFRAIALDTPSGSYVTIFEYDSNPDPFLKNIYRLMLEGSGQPFDEEAYERKRESRIPRLRKATVCRYEGMPTDEIARAIAKAYSPNEMFDATPSIKSYKADRWLEGNYDLRDIEQWQHFFPALKNAFSAYGVEDRFRMDAETFAAREYDRSSEDGFLTAMELGDMLAKADGYLPGDQAAVGIRELERMHCELGLSLHLSRLLRVQETCRNRGHVSEQKAFVHNDLDNGVFAPPSGRDKIDLVVMQDQNRNFIVAIARDEVGKPASVDVHVWGDEPYGSSTSPTLSYPEAFAAAVAREASPSLLASFTLRDGAPVMTSRPDLRTDSIKSWNALISDIETADCCLEDPEPEETALPAP